MFETITIVDPGWDWAVFFTIMAAPICIAVLGLVTLLISRLQATRKLVSRWVDVGQITLIVSGILGFIALVTAGIVGSAVYEAQFTALQLKALNDNGYPATKITNVDSGVDLFIGGDETNYSQGLLIHIDGNEWQVTTAGNLND